MLEAANRLTRERAEMASTQTVLERASQIAEAENLEVRREQ